MQQRNEATGLIVLDRITPVITTLFGCFQQTASQQGNHLFIKLWEDTAPSWRTVHKALIQLSRKLGMPIPAKAHAKIQDQLDWMSWFMRDEESSELKEILRSSDFDGLADIKTLFRLALVLDDGHGLFAIRHEGLLTRGVPALLQPMQRRASLSPSLTTSTASGFDLGAWLKHKGDRATQVVSDWRDALLPQ